MKCPTCAESMQPGMVEATPGLVEAAFFSSIVGPASVIFTADGGGTLPVLRAGWKTRAFHCMTCELVIFAEVRDGKDKGGG